jgi:hypothetical protein
VTLVAATASAQTPPLRLALELVPRTTVKGNHEAAASVSRRVATHLTSQLESEGWQVTRVFSARKAARGGRFHAALRVAVDAKPIFHVTDARVYQDDDGRTLITDHSRSVETWGDWTAWDGMTGRILDDGRIEPLDPQVQTGGAGRPELDDEESMARLLADAADKAVSGALGSSRAASP